MRGLVLAMAWAGALLCPTGIAAGVCWSGSAFNATAIELDESVEDDFFETAAGTARAELGGSAGAISHTIWPQARTDHMDTSQIATQPRARADVRLRFLVESPSNIPLDLAVIAPEGEGGVRLYNETTDSLVYELSGHVTAGHSESLLSGNVYELELYGEIAGDGLSSASATFYGNVTPEPSAAALMLAGLLCFIRRRA